MLGGLGWTAVCLSTHHHAPLKEESGKQHYMGSCLKYAYVSKYLRNAFHDNCKDSVINYCSISSGGVILALVGCTSQRRGPEASGRRFNRVQHGQCTYTFILPEQDGNCRESTTDQYNTNALQRDAPHVEQDFSSQKLQHLEHVMENYTQWLQKFSLVVLSVFAKVADKEQLVNEDLLEPVSRFKFAVNSSLTPAAQVS
ncbi:hypothetical protein DUI87_07221 [Hirundo rustica rustica]|uniref:Uncharacterized protein n=1 Tax=Hirundo rustica rustica TaxID=333673 RepID=A0A3M0KP82_HIRRU|nr:hypothetical protein DUI87_07221 [Hirundo rustica rustica]